jgi:hypothetical protein
MVSTRRAADQGRRRKRSEVAARATELREALDAVATPKNLQRALDGRRLDTLALLGELGVYCDDSSISAATDWLRSHGCRKAVTTGRNTWEWVGIEAEPKPAPTGPALEPGLGEKRDCARWTSCLTAFAMGTPRAVEGRCPSGCAYFVELRRPDLLRAAIDNVAVAHAGANFGGVG